MTRLQVEVVKEALRAQQAALLAMKHMANNGDCNEAKVRVLKAIVEAGYGVASDAAVFYSASEGAE